MLKTKKKTHKNQSPETTVAHFTRNWEEAMRRAEQSRIQVILIAVAAIGVEEDIEGACEAIREL